MLTWHLVKSTLVGVSHGSVLLFDVSGVQEDWCFLGPAFSSFGLNCLAQFLVEN